MRISEPPAGRAAFLVVTWLVAAGGCLGRAAQVPEDHAEGARQPDAGAANDGEASHCVPIARLSADAGLPECLSAPPLQDAACIPSTTGFQPTYKPPSAAHQGKCWPELLMEYRRRCWDRNDPGCDQLRSTPEGRACLECIFTPQDAPAYGPFVDYGVAGATLNTGGCIALLEPCNEACANDYAARNDCLKRACAGCTLGDNFHDCWAAAEACDCRSYAEKKECADLLVGPSHPAAICRGADDDDIFAVIALFCGP
jgi:hypothetical protein